MTGPLGEPRGRHAWNNLERDTIKYLRKELGIAKRRIAKLEAELKRRKNDK